MIPEKETVNNHITLRKIAANYIFPIVSPSIKNGIIVIDEKNTIVNIIDGGENFSEQANLEFYNGILVPGFILFDNPSNTVNPLFSNLPVKNQQQIVDKIFYTLQKNGKIRFEELLSEYTLKAAQLMNCADKFGSLEAGKKPGVNLIYPFDFHNFTLKSESKIKQLV